MQTIALDQNHWIYLARAYHGKPGGAQADILNALSAAVRSGGIRLPLSFLHLVELLRHETQERRIRLAEVFDLLAAGWFMATWPYVLPLEIDRAVAQALGSPPPPHPEVIGRGFLFGMAPRECLELGRHLKRGNLEKIERIASLPGAILDLVASSDEVNRTAQNTSIAQRNTADAASLDQGRHSLRGESKDLRHRVKLANYTLLFQDQLAQSLGRYGIAFRDFCSRGVEFLVDFWSRIPSLHVDCELSLYRDRQWSRAVHPNDFADIGHLVLSIPYCSVVVTERFWARAIQETGLAARYGIAVCSTLDELKSLLAA